VKHYEIRDPVHGFIPLNDWEWDIINQPAFQRLRRIRQLAWTDMVYPGAMHTRFEHSLGVMHVATRLFTSLRRRDGDILKHEFSFEDSGLDRQCQIIRPAALLHDIGHGPFSHATEELLPQEPTTGAKFEHEAYSAAIVKHSLKEVIENHPRNTNNYHITVSEINGVFSPLTVSPKTLVWKNLVSGQMDADRMDYLLRDAYHSGVSYGRYDLDRLVHTIALCEEPDSSGGYSIGVGEDGVHALEGLLVARCMMFTQLYFHKTRSIYDYHLAECMKKILGKEGGLFPAPDEVGIAKYLEWDDWRVLVDRIQHLVPSFDSGDDGGGIGGPAEGLGMGVVLVEEAVDGGLEVGKRTEDAAFQSPLGELGEEALDGIEPGA
jgi:HD superfamily phosphohydrolase